MSEQTTYIRQPIEKPIEYDPYDIPQEFQRLGLLGSSKKADVLTYASGATSESIFDVLHGKYGPHAEVFSSKGFRAIQMNGVEFPVNLLTDRQALEKFYHEAMEAVEGPKEKEDKSIIKGTAEEVFEKVKGLLQDRVPSGATLLYDESEKSEAVGALMADRNEYSGHLSVRLQFPAKKSDENGSSVTIGRLKSTNTFAESANSSQFDRNTYYYETNEKKVNGWIS